MSNKKERAIIAVEATSLFSGEKNMRTVVKAGILFMILAILLLLLPVTAVGTNGFEPAFLGQGEFLRLLYLDPVFLKAIGNTLLTSAWILPVVLLFSFAARKTVCKKVKKGWFLAVSSLVTTVLAFLYFYFLQQANLLFSVNIAAFYGVAEILLIWILGNLMAGKKRCVHTRGKQTKG